MSASKKYREQVLLTPAAKRAKANAAAAAKSFGTPLRFVNHRRPLRAVARLGKVESAQIRKLAWQNGARKTLAALAKDDDWKSIELVDVVDENGVVKYQLYVWPYGCGAVFEAGTRNEIGSIVQHSYDPRLGDLPLRRALAAAYASSPITEIIDFELEREAQEPIAPPPTILDRLIDGRALSTWMLAAVEGDRSALALVEKSLRSDEVVEAIREICRDDVDEIICERSQYRREEWIYTRGDAELVVRATKALRVLGELVAHAGVTRSLVQKGDETFWLAMLACYALITKPGPFPEDAMSLALQAHWAPAPVNEEPIRAILERMSLAQRARWVRERNLDFETADRIEIVGGKRRKVPYAAGAWIFADLVPTPEMAKGAVAAVAAWYPRSQPVERALEVIRALGPQCIPHLDAAIARTKGRNRDVLRRARASMA